MCTYLLLHVLEAMRRNMRKQKRVHYIPLYNNNNTAYWSTHLSHFVPLPMLLLLPQCPKHEPILDSVVWIIYMLRLIPAYTSCPTEYIWLSDSSKHHRLSSSQRPHRKKYHTHLHAVVVTLCRRIYGISMCKIRTTAKEVEQSIRWTGQTKRVMLHKHLAEEGAGAGRREHTVALCYNRFSLWAQFQWPERRTNGDGVLCVLQQHEGFYLSNSVRILNLWRRQTKFEQWTASHDGGVVVVVWFMCAHLRYGLRLARVRRRTEMKNV